MSKQPGVTPPYGFVDDETTVPLWDNPDLTLWHGTYLSAAVAIESGEIDVQFGETRQDFGRGFYTTTVEKQADSWAKTVVERRMRRGLLYEAPAKVKLVIAREQLALLRSLAFTLGGPDREDFWSFVRFCRAGGKDHRLEAGDTFGHYDLVAGPLVSSWRERVLWMERDQISFHTHRAEELLNGSIIRVRMDVP